MQKKHDFLASSIEKNSDDSQGFITRDTPPVDPSLARQEFVPPEEECVDRRFACLL